MSGFGHMSEWNSELRQHPNASPDLWAKLKPLARQMRHAPTDAENALWQLLRNRQVQGAKFRRQHAIERFIVDFICVEAKVVVEVDGAIHDYSPQEDAIRQEFLESLGLLVLRFSNEDVLHHRAQVVDQIDQTCQVRLR